MLRQAAPLAGHQQVAEAVLGVDHLGEHDVAERQAEQEAQAVEDVGQRQRHQHLRHDLQRLAPERLRGLDVALGHAGDRRHGVGEDERHAGDEDEHHLLRLVDAEPEDGQRDQRRDRQVAPEQRERRAGRLEHPARAGEDAERHADQDGEAEADQHALAASPRCSGPARARSAGPGSCRTTSPGLGSITGEIEPVLRRPRRASPPTRPAATSRHRRRRRPACRVMPRRATGAARTASVSRRARIYLAAGERFRRVDLDLDAAVLRVVLRIGRDRRAGPSRCRRPRTGSAGASGTCAPALPSPRWRGSATAPAPGSSAPAPSSTRRCGPRSRCAPRRTARPACRSPRRRTSTFGS